MRPRTRRILPQYLASNFQERPRPEERHHLTFSRPTGAGIGLARHDFDCRGAGACADHRLEIRAAVVLRPVGVIDEVVDRTADGLERDLLRHAGGSDPARRLPSLVP
jgi:hypothetical protein